MRRLALVPILIAVLLFPAAAHALGLGEIEVHSALNQRLDAEIPLRSVPAGQAGDITVRLGSEEAFDNVGLDRPFSLTRLRFEIKQREGGDYYVHITTRESIVEPFLSFLVEVEWRNGNLLREYTILLDPPVFAGDESGSGDADTARTGEAADGAGVPGEIERGSESATGETTEPAGTGDEYGEKPVFLRVEEEEEAGERAERERSQAEAEAAGGRGADTAGEYGPVDEGETLWNIAQRLKRGDMSVQQMMVALLRYNPEAFAGGNINRLQQGYVLRVPNADEVLSISAQRAIAQVRDQNGMWREWQGRSGDGTPVAASEQAAGEAAASGAGGSGEGDAELSIVGSEDGGASSDEAASATSSSADTESEQLQLTREQLEATRMEKEELESRVQELEQTVEKMEKLLTVRDERLSALQEELRELEGEAGESGDESTTAEADGETSGEEAAEEDAVTEDGDDSDEEETVAAADGGETDGTSAGDEAGTDGDTAAEETGDGESADEAETTAGAEDAGEADDAESAYVPDDKRATDADRGLETSRTQPPQETWLDKVNGVLAAIAGIFTGLGGGLLGGPLGLALIAAVVLLGGGLIYMRRRQAGEDSDEEELAEPIDADAEAPFDFSGSGSFEAAEEGPGEDTTRVASGSDEAESALMDEEFDVASLDEGEGEASGAAAQTAAAADEDEADKDDTVAEADVYLAYGLHQQAEDLLRLALREQPDKALYHEKLLETLYASGKTDEFVEEAGTLRGLISDPTNRLWQRTLAMGRDIAPSNELFAEGDTAYTAADVQPAQPAGTDIELDDDGGDIDFGFDDDEQDGQTGAAAQGDDFGSTMTLDRTESAPVDGDAGLVGPDEGAPAGEDAAQADDDLEFDLGDLDMLGDDDAGGGQTAGGAAGAGDDDLAFDLDADAGGGGEESAPAGGGSDESADDLDFDLDMDEDLGAAEPASGGAGEEAAAPAGDSAAAADDDFAFEFDMEEDAGTGAGAESAEAGAAEAQGSDDDDMLDIGDLELGDEPTAEPAESAEAGSEETGSEETGAASTDTGSFDLSDLDAGDLDLGDLDAGADDAADEAAGGEDAAGEFDLDSLGLADDDAPGGDSAETAAQAGPAAAGGGDGEDDEFDTMLDLARAYIDMGDPDSAANALEEIVSSGNDKQRREAESLLESVR